MCRKQPGVAVGRLCEKCTSGGVTRVVSVCFTSLTLSWSFSFVYLFICLFTILISTVGDGLCASCSSFVNPQTLVHIWYVRSCMGYFHCLVCFSWLGSFESHPLFDSMLFFRFLRLYFSDECQYGSNENRCVICSNPGVTDAYYCRECVQLGKDREGCPKIVVRTDTRMLLMLMLRRVSLWCRQESHLTYSHCFLFSLSRCRTWDRPRPIYFTTGRNMVSKRDKGSPRCAAVVFYHNSTHIAIL